jgi:DNA adenine methylase
MKKEEEKGYSNAVVKPKPFVKWVGGKRQLISQFKDLNIYPPKEFNSDKNRYFEPFIGGGAVFFDLLPKNSYISDLNKELIITYNVIKNDVEHLIESLKKHTYSKDYFLKIRSSEIGILSDIEVASRFIYLNRTCFNGLYRVNSKGQFNVPFGKYSNPLICDEVNLRIVSQALKNVFITNQDYKKIEDIAEAGDFVYLDPPYYPINKTSSFTSYTKENFLEKEQIELRDHFKKLSDKGCYVMLSNSDTLFIKEIYSEIPDITINKIKAGRSINSNSNKRGKITEVVITNY